MNCATMSLLFAVFISSSICAQTISEGIKKEKHDTTSTIIAASSGVVGTASGGIAIGTNILKKKNLEKIEEVNAQITKNAQEYKALGQEVRSYSALPVANGSARLFSNQLQVFHLKEDLLKIEASNLSNKQSELLLESQKISKVAKVSTLVSLGSFVVSAISTAKVGYDYFNSNHQLYDRFNDSERSNSKETSQDNAANLEDQNTSGSDQ